MYYQMFKQMPPQMFSKMQPGGTKDFKYCKITMVHSDRVSTCAGPNGVSVPGGNACGFVITIPHLNHAIYHAGDTNMFSDMKIIDDLYRPDVILLPVGDFYGNDNKTVAFAVKNFFSNAKIVVPLWLGRGSAKEYDFAGFVKECEDLGVEGKQFMSPVDFFGGKALIS